MASLVFTGKTLTKDVVNSSKNTTRENFIKWGIYMSEQVKGLEIIS